MQKLTQAMVQQSAVIARESNAKAIVLDVSVITNIEDLRDLLAMLDYPVVLVGRSKEISGLELGANQQMLAVPNVPLTRLGLIKIAVLIGVAEKMFERGNLVVCLSGTQNSDRIDLMTALKVGEEPEFFLSDDASPVPADVQPAVFERLLSIVSELAVEGREGAAVGALFVVGDTTNVLRHSRQMVFNPFHGYPEDERNILNRQLDETIKEFSRIDGAFLIRGDGVVVACGTHLNPQGKAPQPLRSGLGARHEAAAGITAVTEAVAIVLSQSTATISIFNGGRMFTEIERVKRGRRKETVD